VAELVGLDDVEVAVEVPFPVTLRFKQICFTRMLNAISVNWIIPEKRRGKVGEVESVTHFPDRQSCK
jgi:hypothetical protein